MLRSKAGEGAYACVYEAEVKESLKPDDVPEVFAIKVESKKLASWEFLISSRLRERLPRGAPRDIVVPSHLRVLLDAKSQTFTTGALVMKYFVALLYPSQERVTAIARCQRDATRPGRGSMRVSLVCAFLLLAPTAALLVTGPHRTAPARPLGAAAARVGSIVAEEETWSFGDAADDGSRPDTSKQH